jgi:hypothetical protein
MEKTKGKSSKFLKLDRLGRRISHAIRAMEKQRKERAQRSFERQMTQLA